MRKLALSICILWVVAAGTCQAAVVPVIIHLMDVPGAPGGTNDYAIPPGKYLMIRQISIATTSTDANIDIIDSGTGSGVAMLYMTNGYQVVSYNPPVIIPGSNTLHITQWPYAYVVNYYLFGMLVDPADLYAYVPSQFNSFGLSLANVTAGVRLDSPRPARILMENSQDLQAWIARNDLRVQPTTNRAVYTVSDAVDRQNSRFYRATARALQR